MSWGLTVCVLSPWWMARRTEWDCEESVRGSIVKNLTQTQGQWRQWRNHPQIISYVSCCVEPVLLEWRYCWYISPDIPLSQRTDPISWISRSRIRVSTLHSGCRTNGHYTSRASAKTTDRCDQRPQSWYHTSTKDQARPIVTPEAWRGNVRALQGLWTAARKDVRHDAIAFNKCPYATSLFRSGLDSDPKKENE